MARMWPAKLRPDVLSNPFRAAEIRVYRRLQEQLDNGWSVFYSRPWLGLTAAGEEIDGECDFVIAHTQYGMLCVEVKGGSISWDPLDDRWTSRDRHGITHNIKDPVDQARKSKHQLLSKLKERLGSGRRWLRVRHGVIFPDCTAPARDMGPDRPLSIFCFEREFAKDVAAWVRSRFSTAEERADQEQSLGLDGMKALEDLLAAPLTLRVPLGNLVRAEDREMEFLTQQQYHLLGAFDSMDRVCIQGGAGTGKTVLAEHLADSLAGKGLQTLLVCYNEPLAIRLANRHQGVPNLEIGSFHQLCMKTVAAAGQPVEMPTDHRNEFFEVELPEMVVEYCDAPGVRHFDAIIVDEGQDFRELWWVALESLFVRTGPRLLRVFFDCNQRLYGNLGSRVRNLQSIPLHLSWNLRNTREVHKAAYRYYTGREVDCKGPEGEPPVRIVVQSDRSMREALGELLSRLVEREALAPEEIAVLVPGAGWTERLAPAGSIAGVPTQDASQAQPGYVTLDTVRRFKGLECCVLIVIVDENLASVEELCYVALSRGRRRVFLLGSDQSLGRIATAVK